MRFQNSGFRAEARQLIFIHQQNKSDTERIKKTAASETPQPSDASISTSLIFKKLMRQTILFLTALGLLLSCNDADTTNVLRDRTTIKQWSKATESKTKRQLLIEELKRLQAVFASRDSKKIAEIFRFPLVDTTVGIYLDDSTFNAGYEQNGKKVTRAMFLRYFPQISESFQIDEINELFQILKLDDLQQKDRLEHKAFIKTEPCYRFHTIEVEEDIVLLMVGMNSNEAYMSKLVSEDETPENSSEFCEHMLLWVFRFDGKSLRFEKISVAG